MSASKDMLPEDPNEACICISSYHMLAYTGEALCRVRKDDEADQGERMGSPPAR